MESESVPIFILVPHDQVLHNTGSGHADYNVSEIIILEKQNQTNTRGRRHTDLCNMILLVPIHIGPRPV
jgi:hypothetical protein